jgi:hypothetical protein
MHRCESLASGILVALCASVASGAVGSLADFQDGLVQGWTNGGGRNSFPLNISTGGPGGAGDRYLQVSSGTIDGETFPPNLVTLNRTTYAGNYTSAGVTSISMDLRNFSPIDSGAGLVPALPIRIAFEQGFGSTPAYISDAFTLPGDDAWHHATFQISPANFHALGTTDSLATVLSAITEVRILANTTEALQGASGNYRFGVDNILGVSPILKGDWDRDGSVTPADVRAMLQGLTNLDAYKAQKSLDNAGLLSVGDFTSDGQVTNLDIQPLLSLVGGGSIAPVPEPATLGMACFAAIGLVGLVRRGRINAA